MLSCPKDDRALVKEVLLVADRNWNSCQYSIISDVTSLLLSLEMNQHRNLKRLRPLKEGLWGDLKPCLLDAWPMLARTPRRGWLTNCAQSASFLVSLFTKAQWLNEVYCHQGSLCKSRDLIHLGSFVKSQLIKQPASSLLCMGKGVGVPQGGG